MAKKSAKSDPTAPGAPKKRSKLKLALMVLAPLAIAGGGFAGWIYYPGINAASAAHPEADPVEVSSVPAEIAAETSFTHSYALASIIAHQCGKVPVKALKAVSDTEARADGMLVNLSWAAAARRVYSLDERNCRMFLTEVRTADARAARIVAAQEKAGER